MTATGKRCTDAKQGHVVKKRIDAKSHQDMSEDKSTGE